MEKIFSNVSLYLYRRVVPSSSPLNITVAVVVAVVIAVLVTDVIVTVALAFVIVIVSVNQGFKNLPEAIV